MYELKYRMPWSGTIYILINYKETTPNEIASVKKVETA